MGEWFIRTNGTEKVDLFWLSLLSLSSDLIFELFQTKNRCSYQAVQVDLCANQPVMTTDVSIGAGCMNYGAAKNSEDSIDKIDNHGLLSSNLAWKQLGVHKEGIRKM